MIQIGSPFHRSDLPVTGAKPLEKSDESVDEHAGGGTCQPNTGSMGDDADHALVGAVRSGAVRERNNGKPEQPSEDGADG